MRLENFRKASGASFFLIFLMKILLSIFMQSYSKTMNHLPGIFSSLLQNICIVMLHGYIKTQKKMMRKGKKKEKRTIKRDLHKISLKILKFSLWYVLQKCGMTEKYCPGIYFKSVELCVSTSFHSKIWKSHTIRKSENK